jgi:hypothetical protein
MRRDIHNVDADGHADIQIILQGLKDGETSKQHLPKMKNEMVPTHLLRGSETRQLVVDNL